MTIEQHLHEIITNYYTDKKLREESIKFKQDEVKKYTNFINKYKEEIDNLEKESIQEDLKIFKLREINDSLKEEIQNVK